MDFFRLRDTKDHSVCGKTDQIFTLYRFLPIILCYLIPQQDEPWQFLLHYFDLISLLLSPSFVQADLVILSYEIRK